MKKLIILLLLVLASSIFMTGCSPQAVERTIGLGESAVYRGFEISVGNTVEFKQFSGGEIIARVPVVFTNVSNSSSGWVPTFSNVWSPNGVSIQANMQNEPDEGLAGFAGTITVREGSSHATMINFRYTESGIYEIVYRDGWITTDRNEVDILTISVDVNMSSSTSTREPEVWDVNHNINIDDTFNQIDIDLPFSFVSGIVELNQHLIGRWLSDEYGTEIEFYSDGFGYMFNQGTHFNFIWLTVGDKLIRVMSEQDVDIIFQQIVYFDVSDFDLTITFETGHYMHLGRIG